MEIPVLVHTFLWSCVLKASVVEHQSIPSINTWSTLKGNLNQYLVNTWSTSQSVDSQLIFVAKPIRVDLIHMSHGQHLANNWLSVDQVSVKMSIECWSSVDHVLIEMLIDCWSRWVNQVSIKGFLIAFEMPLPLGYEYFLEQYHLTFNSCLHKLVSLLNNYFLHKLTFPCFRHSEIESSHNISSKHQRNEKT